MGGAPQTCYADVWTLGSENELSYAGTDMGAGYQVTYNTALNTNRVSFSLRRDAAANAGNAHMGVCFTAANGDGYSL